jgi:CTP synthase (UTP-ammonia lyase)
VPAALTIGIIGDYQATSRFHDATNTALQHAAGALSIPIDVVWLPTPSLAGEHGAATLRRCAALWCAPGSPYQSMEGALQAIRFAREQGRPFIGT